MLRREDRGHLTQSEFLEVIKNTPLVSIDLVLRDASDRILLGLRVNEPAKDQWFVPGGRVKKGLTLEEAFSAICQSEIRERHTLSEARFVGCFTHVYETNVFVAPDVSTHYVVLAFELRLPDGFEPPQRTDQHSAFRWFSRDEVDPESGRCAYEGVHANVLAYFRSPQGMEPEQYQILNERRNVHNNLVWQTPVISLTAQAFLFTIILSSAYSGRARAVAAILALIASCGSMQLMAKHRFMEKELGSALHGFENATHRYAANRRMTTKKWGLARLSSYSLWMIVLGVFFIAAAAALGVLLERLF